MTEHVGHRGAGLGGGNDEREQTLNQLLVEMDGFDTQEGIILVAATNRPDVLDPALLRPGRFDRQVVVDVPDLQGRHDILKIHTKKIKINGFGKGDLIEGLVSSNNKLKVKNYLELIKISNTSNWFLLCCNYNI